MESADTVEVALAKLDRRGRVCGETRAPRACFHRIGDFAVTEADSPLEPYAITHVPSGRTISSARYRELAEATRYADAWAVVLAGVDAAAVTSTDERRAYARAVRELVLRNAAGGDTCHEGAFDQEGS